LTRRALLPAGFLIGVFLIPWALSSQNTEKDYAILFGAKYAEAEKFLRQNSWIANSLRLSPQETQFALAVVFPEIIRFKALEDKIQVRALKVLYVQYGRKYADFSVGHFQMKPTFAEQIERDYNRLFSSQEKAAAEITPFEAGETSRLRKERVLRLNDLHWQARYLRLLMMVMDKLYGNLTFATDLEKLRFYATAFNCGYASGEKAIRKKMGLRRFHIQWIFAKTLYNYADVSVFFYSRNIPPRMSRLFFR